MEAGTKAEIALLLGVALLLVAVLLGLRQWRARGRPSGRGGRLTRVAGTTLTLLIGVALIASAILPTLRISARAVGEAEAAHALRPSTLFQHSVSGWGIYTPQDAQQAADDGLSNVFLYGPPYAPETAMGQTLSGLHLSQVDGALWQYLHEYECTKLLARGLSIQDTAGYCPIDYGESLDELYSDVQNHLKMVASDPNIVGFWILDDWPWQLDPGGAVTALQQITQMVHTLAPGRPTICGIGAELGAGKNDVWHGKVATNFTPTGCDAVGVYVYSESVTDPKTSPETFDWSMSTLLPKIVASLQARGWQPQRQPMIGIAQAWAGSRQDVAGYYEITPSAEDLALQALSFCRAGVAGIAFYGWRTSELSNLQTPANNGAINDGMREGIARCQQVWGGA